METKIYANYGVLAHEKEPVYTMIPIVDELADELTVVIPDEYMPYKTQYDNIAVIINGHKYLLCDAIECFPWFLKKIAPKRTITEDENNG